jgi:hypothetical protein
MESGFAGGNRSGMTHGKVAVWHEAADLEGAVTASFSG